MRPINTEQFYKQLEPGISGSKHAGFKGERTTKKGKDRNCRDCYLIKIDGWHQYSKNYGRYIHRAALCVRDETGDHMIRVSPQCETVADALNYIEPAEVKKARAEKRKVFRQGDFYFVEKKSGKSNLSAIGRTRHNVADNAITHPEHTPLHLPDGAWKAVRQRSTNGNID